MNNLSEKPNLPIIAYLYSANDSHIILPILDEAMAKEALESDEVSIIPLSDSTLSLTFTAAYLERYVNHFMENVKTALPEATEAIEGLNIVTNIIFQQLIEELGVDEIIEEAYSKQNNAHLH